MTTWILLIWLAGGVNITEVGFNSPERCHDAGQAAKARDTNIIFLCTQR